MKELPFTPNTQLKNPRWSYLYAYNLRTLRDLFVYCAQKEKIKETSLYEDMASNLIPPPKNVWVSKGIKRKERLRLEYVHAAEYLGLIKRENGLVMPNYDSFPHEKKIILKENAGRVFATQISSPPLSEKEKKGLIGLLLSYERAKDFLWWFFDFNIYKDSNGFSIDDFKNKAKPIFLLGKTVVSQRGSEVLRKFGDNTSWKIPENYGRLANFVFPSWLSELGLIDRAVEFPDFSKDKQLWHMFYPLRMTTDEFLKLDGKKLFEELFLTRADKQSLWIPYVLYVVAIKYGCPVEAIKIKLERLFKDDYEHFYLERTSLQVMKKHSKYEGSYIKVDGFFRSTLILKKGE